MEKCADHVSIDILTTQRRKPDLTHHFEGIFRAVPSRNSAQMSRNISINWISVFFRWQNIGSCTPFFGSVVSLKLDLRRNHSRRQILRDFDDRTPTPA